MRVTKAWFLFKSQFKMKALLVYKMFVR